MTEKHFKKSSKSLVIREVQIKTDLKFHLTPVRIIKISKRMAAHADEDLEYGEHTSIVCGVEILYSHHGE